MATPAITNARAKQASSGTSSNRSMLRPSSASCASAAQPMASRSRSTEVSGEAEGRCSDLRYRRASPRSAFPGVGVWHTRCADRANMKKIDSTTPVITKNKLVLNKETVKELNALDLRQVVGGLRLPSGRTV